uniref:Uncharacterized protein n=1 Tax=Panagrolaimus sp. PS1159 TaxID=55785 RepID=A0AC35FZL2_9BILA
MLFNKLFKPYGLLEQSVRYNCPWHRSNWRPCYFPFKLLDKLRFRTVDAYKSKPGGKQLLMRRLLREQHFIGWQHDHKPKSKKLSYPL